MPGSDCHVYLHLQGVALTIFRDSADIISIAYVFVTGDLHHEGNYEHRNRLSAPGRSECFPVFAILTRTRLLERGCEARDKLQMALSMYRSNAVQDVCPSTPGFSATNRSPTSRPDRESNDDELWNFDFQRSEHLLPHIAACQAREPNHSSTLMRNSGGHNVVN